VSHAQGQVQPGALEAFGSWLRLSQGAALGPDGSSLPSHPLVRACCPCRRAHGTCAACGL